MKLYFYLTLFFLLCFYILICNANEASWIEMVGYTSEDLNDLKKFQIKHLVTLNPSELMKIRNATALQFWRRSDFDSGEKKVRHKDKDIKTNNRKGKKMDKEKSKFRRNPEANSNESTLSSPLMRAHYRTRDLNFRPKFRQVTSDYRSTRITPMADDNWDDARGDAGAPGMNQMMSAFNLEAEVRSIISQFTTINMSIETIGRTVEYKDIILVKITESTEAKLKRGKFRATSDDKFIDEQPEKKIVFIVHGLSVMGIQYVPCLRRKSHFKKLVSFYLKHLDRFDVYLVPMANPDGYAYVMNSVGLKWNKNIAPQFACKGVALDRNFDVAWNATQAVSSCSQQYPGVAPFSEPETRAIRDLFHRYGHKIVAYINVHSGSYDANTFKGDAVLYPRGYTDASMDDDKYIDLRGEIEETIKNGSFEAISVYVDTLHSWYGRVSGTSVDYASTVYGVQFALEFVMQIYNGFKPDSDEKEDPTSNAALEEIWGRVIDTVFKTVWKSLQQVNDLK